MDMHFNFLGLFTKWDFEAHNRKRLCHSFFEMQKLKRFLRYAHTLAHGMLFSARQLYSPGATIFCPIMLPIPKHKTTFLHMHTNHTVTHTHAHTNTQGRTHTHTLTTVYSLLIQPFQHPSRCFVSIVSFKLRSLTPSISPSLCDSFPPATYHRRVGGQWYKKKMWLRIVCFFSIFICSTPKINKI